MSQIPGESFSPAPALLKSLLIFFKKYLEDIKLPYNFASTLQEWLMV